MPPHAERIQHRRDCVFRAHDDRFKRLQLHVFVDKIELFPRIVPREAQNARFVDHDVEHLALDRRGVGSGGFAAVVQVPIQLPVQVRHGVAAVIPMQLISPSRRKGLGLSVLFAHQVRGVRPRNCKVRKPCTGKRFLKLPVRCLAGHGHVLPMAIVALLMRLVPFVLVGGIDDPRTDHGTKACFGGIHGKRTPVRKRIDAPDVVRHVGKARDLPRFKLVRRGGDLRHILL